MIPYLIVLLSVVVIAYAGRIANDRLLRWFSLGLVALILIGFAGLRSSGVGTDTGTYLRHFSRADTASYITHSTEIGSNLLMWLARSASDSYAVLFTLIAAIVVGCYLWASVKLVKRYEMALFVFITLGVYTFFFNGARQGVAAAICFAALPFLLERRALPYFLTVGVAALFHHSALVVLPLYYLAARRLEYSKLLLMAGATAVLILFRDVVVQLATDLISEKYATYAQQGEGGGEVFASFYVAQGIGLFAVRNRVKRDREVYMRLLYVYLMGLIPVVASVVSSVNPSGFLRLHAYFAHVAIIMWPMVLHQLGGHRDRVVASLAYAVLMVGFFYLTTTTFSNLAPYRVNEFMSLW